MGKFKGKVDYKIRNGLSSSIEPGSGYKGKYFFAN